MVAEEIRGVQRSGANGLLRREYVFMILQLKTW